MAEALTACSPLDRVLRPGRHGRSDGAAAVRVSERMIGGAASLAARNGGVAALSAALGWELPANPRRVTQEGHMIVWTGPRRWLVFSAQNIVDDLRARARTTGSVADQSDSRVMLRIEGPCARDALAKGVSIDLHPRAFAIGDAAATPAAHIPALLWREDEEAFVITVPRGFAGSFTTWLLESALEYGVQVG